MKFLFVSEYFPPVVLGGAEISLKILIDELVKNGHDVVVLTPNYHSFKTEIEKNNNLKIIRFKSFRYFLLKRREKTTHKVYKKTKSTFHIILNHYIKYSIFELKKNIENVLKHSDFDILHANNLESILALNTIKTPSKKIAHLRDFGIFCYNRGLDNNHSLCNGCSISNLNTCMNAKGITNKILVREIKKRSISFKLSSFDSMIAISNFVKENYVGILGIDNNKVNVLYNPVSDEVISKLSKHDARSLLNLPKDKKIVLFVGGLTEKKGAHLIPEIAKKLKSHVFIVIGEGVMEDIFLKNRPHNIIYTGYLPISEVKHYYKASDILVVPSLWHEPFGRVVLEGAYNGCHVIGSDTGGIPEVINWLKCGVYIKPTVENFVKEINSYDEKTSKKQKLCDHDYYNEFINIISKLSKN